MPLVIFGAAARYLECEDSFFFGGEEQRGACHLKSSIFGVFLPDVFSVLVAFSEQLRAESIQVIQ